MAQGQRLGDEEEWLDRTVAQQAAVCWVSSLDWSTTAPLVPSALQAGPPGRSDPP